MSWRRLCRWRLAAAGVVLVAGCGEDAARVRFPAAPLQAEQGVEPAGQAEAEPRRMLAELGQEEFAEAYRRAGEPRFVVLVNREFGEGNPAQTRLTDLVQIRKESTAEWQDAGDAGGGEAEVVVNVGNAGADDRDTRTTVAVRQRDKGDIEVINDALVESSVAKVLREYKVRINDVDIAARAAREQSGAGESSEVTLEDIADVALLVRTSFDARGVLGYSAKAIRLADGRVLAQEAEAEAPSRRGRAGSDDYERYFQRQAREVLRGVLAAWQEED